MSRLLVLSIAPGEGRGALFEDGAPVELRVERDDRPSQVGGLFVGRIARVLPALPGSFVELGLDRPGFLPGEHLPDGAKPVEGAAILVQVVKDAVGDKAPELTASPSFHGKFGVWTPRRPGIAVSRQIVPAERDRLSTILASLLKPDEGIVLRTHATDVSREDLVADIEKLRGDYRVIEQSIARVKPPARLDRVAGIAERLVSAFPRDIDGIVIDDRAAFATLKEMQGLELDVAPGFAERHELDAVFALALSGQVALPNGAHATIESGTAFTAIDVDLGTAAGGRGRAHEAIRQVNLDAAAAIVRQLRLRNIGGAVVIDFVSMERREHRREVEDALRRAVREDPIGVELHGWTRLGHFEVTRRRTSPSLADLLLEPAVRRKTVRTVALEVIRALAKAPFQPGAALIRLHPLIAAELNGPLAPQLAAAVAQAGRKIGLSPDAARDIERFDIGNG